MSPCAPPQRSPQRLALGDLAKKVSPFSWATRLVKWTGCASIASRGSVATTLCTGPITRGHAELRQRVREARTRTAHRRPSDPIAGARSEVASNG